MDLLTRSRRLSAADWGLLVRAGTRLVVVRLALRALPFGVVRKLGRRARHAAPARPRAPLSRVVWALGWANRVFPGATCLPRALAAESLLKRMGHPATLHIGVTREGGRPLDAHAWVECDGRIVAGGDGVERYAALDRGAARR